MKLQKQLLTLPLLLGISCPLLMGAPETPVEAYQEIHELLKAGRVEKALELLTPEARNEYLLGSLDIIAASYATKDKFQEDFTLPDGTKVKTTPEDLGFKTLGLPDDQGGKAYEESLLNLFEEAKDKGAFLRSLELLASALEPNDFSGKTVDTPKGIAAKPSTLWITFDDDETFPVSFQKGENGLKYAGIDWDALNELERLFVEQKDISISGMTTDGKEVKLSDYLGKVVLIDFWGTW